MQSLFEHAKLFMLLVLEARHGKRLLFFKLIIID